MLPVSSSPFIGSEKWGAGPTFVVLKQFGPWTTGALVNHIVSFAGSEERAENVSLVQPFLSFATAGGYSFGVNSGTGDTEILAWASLTRPSWCSLKISAFVASRRETCGTSRPCGCATEAHSNSSFNPTIRIGRPSVHSVGPRSSSHRCRPGGQGTTAALASTATAALREAFLVRFMLCCAGRPDAESQAQDKENPVGIFSRKKDSGKTADFSNVQSGSSSTAAEVPSAPSGEQVSGTTGTTQTYVVVKGDSLSKIAKQFYGDAQQWRRIYDANRDQISNPDLIHPGQNLKIPGA
jgi:hypothetical protein